MTKQTLLFVGLCSVVLSACSSQGIQTDSRFEDKNRTDLYKNGSLLGEEGGFDFLKDKSEPSSQKIALNPYLWRATLDTISFLPIATADPFGGVITTEWYNSPDDKNERLKLNVFILDRDLRADGVRVRAFKQKRDHDSDQWVDVKTDPSVSTTLEETILTRARQLRNMNKK